jgi:hypothetical protein
MTADNFCFYLQNRLIQTSQTGGQWYSDTSPLVFPGSYFTSAQVPTFLKYGLYLGVTFILGLTFTKVLQFLNYQLSFTLDLY